MDNLTNGIVGGTFCITNPAVVIDANAKADMEITPAITYVIEGYMYPHADSDGEVQFDGHTVTSKYSALFLACIAADETVTVTKSKEVLNADITAGNAVMHWPAPTADSCPICGIVITNDSASVFTGGTTLLDASDIYYDTYDLLTVPEGVIAILAT